MAQGKWSDFKETTTMGDRPTIERADLTPMTGFAYDGSSDFKATSLNVNLVLRWEMDPGSVLYMVYTRGQESDGAHHRLATGPTEDVMLVKFVYYVTR
jgi:hypothetical protein